mmetsp:Transcript_5447/g.13686  ORF Transcript_5447/g.13686 Transcript_5447/m.13686 type:complete len:81 (+) Transcript_5447:277-519(+)|eukprot:g1735.t1
MGRSNGCEANRKRADAAKRAAKYAKDGNSQLANNTACMTLQCKICLQSFMSTQVKMAKMHHEQKHAKNTFEECFPDVPQQ